MNLSRLLAYRSQIEEALRIELAAAARPHHTADRNPLR